MLKARTVHRFSVEDYDRMIDTGILTEEDRVELIRGEILDKMPIGNAHVACVMRLNRLLHRLVGDRALIGVQSPIRFDDSEPEPDVSLIEPRPDFYRSAKPHAENAFLVVEVADSTLDSDRELKRPLYAESGIPEYWIVNLIDSCVEVHRDPQPDGVYRSIQTFQAGDRVEILKLPGIWLAVSEILG